MTDDFLHCMRKEPSARFIESLKQRLAQIESEPPPAWSWWRRGLVGAGVMAGVALAAGIYVTCVVDGPRASSNVMGQSVVETPVAPPRRDPTIAAQEGAQKVTTADSQIKSAEGIPAPRQFGVAASVSMDPLVKEATRYMNSNMHVYPPFAEPAFSLSSDDAMFGSICGADDAIQVIVTGRRILANELETCRAGKKHIAEVKLGYAIIAVVNSSLYPQRKFTARQLFLGLAREVPDPVNPETLIPNPYTTWDQIDSTLPNERIDVLGAPDSSTRTMLFRDTLLKAGCHSLPTVAALKQSDAERFETVCGSIRTDGYYRARDAIHGTAQGAFDLVGYLQASPGALAIVAYGSELSQGRTVSAAAIDGIAPSLDSIHSGAYPGSRLLYLYVNKATPAMRDFSHALWSSIDRYSADSVFLPLDPAEQRSALDQVLKLAEL